MSNFLFTLCICFFALQQETKAANCGTNTPKLKPNEKLLITIFDKNYEAGDGKLWSNVCEIIKKFPAGLITMEYRPGCLAKGTEQSITCESGPCNIDQYHGCELSFYKNINDCFKEAEGGSAALISTVLCYCNQESNKLLLENAALRVSLNIPEDSIPALAFNTKYDPCVKIGTFDDIKAHVCTMYENKVHPCT